jgi:glycosyltransferase involved in cell wall biosynthesis/putative flippase GtrA
MKILVATGAYPPDIGGPATYSALLSTELPKQGVVCDVLSFGGVRHLPKIVRHLAYFGQVIWHARSSDVIFAQDTVSVGLPAMLAAHLLGVAFVVRVPGDYAWEQSTQRYGVTDTIDEFQTRSYGSKVERLRKIQKFVVRHADRVIAPSKYFADLVRGWTPKPEHVEHIYNGIDLAEISDAARGAKPEPRTIVSAGRLVPWKGFPMLIRAMKELPGWKLAIAGDGPERSALEKLIADEGLSDRVTLLGRIDRKLLAQKIAAAEVFALNTHFESFAFQLVEAMAAGAPVITTRVGNLPEIIEDGKNGMLIAPDDEAAFVAAVQKLDADPALRARMTAEARSTAATFSIDATIAKALALMSSVLEARPTAAKRKIMSAKIIRYIFSGGLAAVTNLVLLWLFIYEFHIFYLLSTILAFVFAFCVSFVMQKFFTFQDHGKEGVHGQAAIYLVVTGINLLINTGLMYLFVDKAHVNPIVSQIVIAVILAIESYVVYGMFIFKADRIPATAK